MAALESRIAAFCAQTSGALAQTTAMPRSLNLELDWFVTRMVHRFPRP
jgi:hypothetical protein